MALTKTQVSELYVAIFNRASEGKGNTYWQGEGSAAEVAQKMLDTVDAKEYFGTAIDDDKAFIEHIYINALGKNYADDAEGIDFWVARLASGETRGEVVAALVAAAKDPQYAGTAAQQRFLNRVDVSDYAADNIQNEPENYKQTLGFNGDLVVTEDLGTISQAKKAVDELAVETDGGSKGETSLLTEALEALQKAEADKAEFLKEAAEIDEVKAAVGADTEAKITAAVGTADAAVATVAYTASTGPATKIVYLTTDTDGVKAAKVADAQADLADDLKEANKALNEAKAEVAKVSGLKSAIELHAARVEAQESTGKALTAAEASAAATVAASTVANAATVATGIGSGLITDIKIGGMTVTQVKNGQLVAADSINASDYVDFAALLSSANAYNSAYNADQVAQQAIEAAVIAIGYIDFTSGDKDGIGAKFATPVTAGANSDKLTQAQVAAEVNKLKGLASAEGELEFDSAGLITTVGGVAYNAGTHTASKAYNDLKTAVNTFEATLDGSTSPLFVAQNVEQTAVDDVQAAIDALTDALKDLSDVKAIADELKAFNTAIADAKKAFADLDVEAPVSVDGVVVGTADNDVFLFADKAGNIVNFNAQGEDLLFVGNKFSLVTLTAEQTINQRVGDAAEWEIFAKQNGADVDLYVEQQTFAGNGINETDIVKITLSGVNVADLQLEDGFISIA